MNRTRLRAQLERHEGRRARVYRDSLGIATIGVGRNLEDPGLSDEEIDYLLDNDITARFHALTTRVACFGSLDETRQHVLIDMAFMGIDKLLGFTKMLAAIEARDWEKAADELLDSQWAGQVGQRAKTLAKMLRDG